MDDFGSMGLSSIAEINYLRLEAMELFEHCLAEGRSHPLEAFIEQLISREPPPLELLREIAADLNQRLVSLREYHSDVLERVGRTLADDFGFQPDALTPGNLEKFIDSNSQSLSSEEAAMLHRVVNVSLETAAQLRSDVIMTERLCTSISDWINALNATVARRFWANGRSDKYSGGVH